MSDDPLDEASWLQAARMAELGVLSASLMHELRQPLFAIKAMAQLSRADGAMDAERIAQLIDQVRHLESLVDAYADYGRASEHDSLFDLNQPVRGALKMLAWRGRSAGAPLQADLAVESLLVRGREGATRQVVVNLVSNAIDAVEGLRGHVVVRTREAGDRVRLVVEDDGPGVPDEVRTRLFEPFVTTKPPGRGTGLGLYIAHKLVTEANGVMRVESLPQRGTRVEVELPRAA